jgi:hypothetical protein
LVRADIDRPHSVLCIDAQAVGDVESVDVLTELAHVLPVAVELKELRTTVEERSGIPKRGDGVTGARVDEDLSLRVRPDARHFSYHDVKWCAQKIDRVERDFRNRRLSG